MMAPSPKNHICLVTVIALIVLIFHGTGFASETEKKERLRDPFWPVDYDAPPPPEVKEGPIAAARGVSWPDLPVRGRSRAADGSYRALIDGVGVVKEGEDISIQKEGYWFHWRILKIDARQMQTERLGITRQQNQLPGTPAP